MKRLLFLLLSLLPASFGSLRAQTFDLAAGRIPVASLDGLWRFHPGDNPSWANPGFDDSQWPLLRSDTDWASQGYSGYSGLAWYRFQVAIPAGLDHVSLLLPAIRTCYQVYADGKLVGTYGKMPPNVMGFAGGGPQVYELPVGSPSARTGSHPIQIALRVWQFPGWAAYVGGGPASGGSLIGDTAQVQQQRSFLETQAFWSDAAVEILALLQDFAGLGAVALFLFRRKEREYLWFGLAMLFNSVGNWLWISILTHVWPLNFGDAVGDLFHTAAWIAVPLFYWELLKARRSWLLNFSLSLLVFDLLVEEIYNLSGLWQHIWALNLIRFLAGLPITLWILTVLFSKAKQGSPDARLLLLPQLPYSALFLLSSTVFMTFQLGWQHTFRGTIQLTATPFPISLDQVADALFPLAVFAILLLRFSRTRSEEERFAGEVLAARNVQQFLIPENLPVTPGLAIESEYRPAREVGGDFFQVLPNTQDGSVLIVVGDVAGHGMESGMLATLIVGAIRTAVSFTADPARILALLNERMQGRGLATCLALRIEKDGSAALANAGHLPPYLNGHEMAMEGALPLGAIPAVHFPAQSFQLNPADTLLLMTDGVAEAQNKEGRLFGFERIGAMLESGVTAANLAAAAQNFGQQDDITVLTVARTNAATIS